MGGITDMLQEWAAEKGLLAGVVDACPLPHLEERLQRRLAEARVTPFEEKDPARRIDPAFLLPGCRSIVVIGLPYHPPHHPIPGAEGPRGEVARCARCLDYHRLIEEKGVLLAERLRKELGGNLRYRVLADRSPLVERELARLAGLGGIGENCTLINPEYGSYVALGTLLLDRKLPSTAPASEETCRRCGRCREACPTGALREPYLLDPRRCLSYITQAPGTVPLEMRPLLGNRLYGCDRCQEVCPCNENASSSRCRETVFSFFPGNPLLLPILTITRKEFALTVGLSAAGWRGKTTLQRNAVIALGNSGDTAAIPALARLLRDDPRPVIRLHAAWALGRLGGAEARRHLGNALCREKESAVLEEIRRAASRI